MTKTNSASPSTSLIIRRYLSPSRPAWLTGTSTAIWETIPHKSRACLKLWAANPLTSLCSKLCPHQFASRKMKYLNTAATKLLALTASISCWSIWKRFLRVTNNLNPTSAKDIIAQSYPRLSCAMYSKIQNGTRPTRPIKQRSPKAVLRCYSTGRPWSLSLPGWLSQTPVCLTKQPQQLRPWQCLLLLTTRSERCFMFPSLSSPRSSMSSTQELPCRTSTWSSAK